MPLEQTRGGVRAFPDVMDPRNDRGPRVPRIDTSFKKRTAGAQVRGPLIRGAFFLGLSALVFLVGACSGGSDPTSTPEPTPAPTATPSPAPTPAATPTPFPTVTPFPTITPLPAPTPVPFTESYANERASDALDYPAGWVLQEIDFTFVVLAH